jgi:hypothetical protein
VPAVRMSAYHDSHGPVRPDTFLDFAAQARAQGTPLPPLLLDAIRCLPLHFAATPEQVQAPTEGGHAGRDWQHRWVVRMHKVRQWYPSLQQHKVLYRGPYIKGPPGKPLMPGESVWALSR